MPVLRSVKNIVRNHTDAEVKVREATSNDPWGPSSTLMTEIADLTYNVVAFTEIMGMVWKRLNDHGKNWRHVYKALTLLEYIIKTGSDKVGQQCKENIFAIQTLKDFQFMEENKDHGQSVREKANAMVALLKDEERLKNERAKALKAKERFAQNAFGIGSNAQQVPFGSKKTLRYPPVPEGNAPAHQSLSRSTPGGSNSPSVNSPSRSVPPGGSSGPVPAAAGGSGLGSDIQVAMPASAGEEELQLQLALAMSREEADTEAKKKEKDDMKLKMALEESSKEQSDISGPSPAATPSSSLLYATPPAIPGPGQPWITTPQSQTALPAAAVGLGAASWNLSPPPASSGNQFQPQQQYSLPNNTSSSPWTSSPTPPISNLPLEQAADPWATHPTPSHNNISQPASLVTAAGPPPLGAGGVVPGPWDTQQAPPPVPVKNLDPWDTPGEKATDPWATSGVSSDNGSSSTGYQGYQMSSNGKGGGEGQRHQSADEFDILINRKSELDPVQGLPGVGMDGSFNFTQLQLSEHPLSPEDMDPNGSKKPEDFLGANANLVNLDNLISKPTQSSLGYPINPFGAAIPAASGPPVAHSSLALRGGIQQEHTLGGGGPVLTTTTVGGGPNPFAANAAPRPSLNQMSASSSLTFSQGPSLPNPLLPANDPFSASASSQQPLTNPFL